MTDLADIWVYLAASPLLGLGITLVAYLAGDWIYRRAGQLCRGFIPLEHAMTRLPLAV